MAFDEKTRHEIFLNAGGKCEKCGRTLILNNHKEGQVGAWDAHHKISVKRGGENIASNGKALCLQCHKDTYSYGEH